MLFDAMSCTNCGAPLSATAPGQTCHYCGAAVVPPGQHESLGAVVDRLLAEQSFPQTGVTEQVIVSSQTTVVVNDVEYKSLEEMPEDLRAIAAAALGAVKGPHGASLLTSGTHITTTVRTDAVEPSPFGDSRSRMMIVVGVLLAVVLFAGVIVAVLLR
jgi:hypothetical protein